MTGIRIILAVAALAGTAAWPAEAIAPPGPAAAVSRPSEPVRERFWVYFRDKGYPTAAETQAAVAEMEHTYNPRAIERRRWRRTAPGLFDVRDLPVHQPYLDQLTVSGAKIHLSSRWLNAASIIAGPAQRAAISRLPFVASVEPVRSGRREQIVPLPLPDDGGQNDFEFYGYARAQLDQVNLIAVHEQGFTGKGVIVGILDTGFERVHAAFKEPGHPVQIIAEHDFVMGDDNTAPQPGDPEGQAWHGTIILGLLGAYKPGLMIGGVYDASFILCKTEDTAGETPIEEDNYAAGLEFIEANGGDVATASLIYLDWYTQDDLDGQTAVSTIAVNTATANGLYCCNGAGNFGHDDDPATSRLGAPGDAFEVLTCGAADANGFIADFSSDGPTADGREKPEVLARGVGAASVNPSEDADPDSYAAFNGTSVATPLVASAVACLAGAKPQWSVGHMRDRLMTTASDFAMYGVSDPLFVRGHGIINAAAALGEPECYPDCDPSTGAGVLDLFDFLCFVNAFVAQEPYADCDQSTGAGVLDLFDFLCFVNAFNEGC